MARLNDRAVRILRRQHSVITRPQLLRAGHDEAQVEWMVHTGELVRLHQGTYAVRGAASTPHQVAMAAVLRCRPRAWLTGSFVLALFGVEGFDLDSRFDVIVPSGRRVQNVPFTVRTDPTPGWGKAGTAGIPIVVPRLALVGAARYIGPRRLIAAIDSGKWLKLWDNRSLMDVMDRLGPRDPGARAVRQLVESAELEHESQGERLGLRDLLAGIEPQPEWQVWITPGTRVDGYWRDAALALEYLGARHHGDAQRPQDAKRHAELREMGILVLYVTKEDLRFPSTTRERILSTRRARVAALSPSQT